MMQRRAFCGLLAAMVVAGAAGAQEKARILLVDRQRVLTESAPARQLRELEQQRRIALRAQLDAIQAELEAEEQDIGAARGQISKEAFAARVQEFDRKVRDARRSSQALGEGLQADFEAARQKLVASLIPIMNALLAENGADLVLDLRGVLAARPGIDVTDQAIERLNAAGVTFTLTEQPAD